MGSGNDLEENDWGIGKSNTTFSRKLFVHEIYEQGAFNIDITIDFGVKK
mgnify:CR=1 FL=1